MHHNNPRNLRGHDKPTARPRRGVATLWVIVAALAMLALLVLVTDVARLWLARVELENAVEAGALAGAKVWGDGDDNETNRTAAHVAAKAFAEANTVLGKTIVVDANNDPNAVNNNATCPGDVLLGKYTAGNFQGNVMPDTTNKDDRACRVAASATVTSLWLGFPGPFEVHASAVARYRTDLTNGNTAILVRVNLGDDPCQ